MTLNVRTKLLLVSIALIIVSMGAADGLLTSSVATHLSDSIRSDLIVRARLLARDVSSTSATLEEAGGWDRLARGLAQAADAHVTIIRRDGVVLGDSELAADELGRLENQARRPEVAQALDHGSGASDRPNAVLEERISYAAAAFDRGGAAPWGVVRLGRPLTAVDRATSDVRRVVWLGSGAALALALILFSVLANRMSAAVGELTDAARRMTEGDLSVRTRLVAHDDLAELGQALDRLAGSLATTVGQLGAERDLHSRILEAMQEGVVVVGRSGRIVLVNPALRSMLLVGADAVGKLLIEAVRHAQLEDLLVAARASSGASQMEIELPGLKPRRLLVHAAPLSGGDDRLLFVFVDVTELRRLESLRRDFVANASHELRTPIAAVRSATETLRSGALDDSRAAVRFVDIIERNAQRLQSLVEDMLELSKLESNEFALKRERVDLGGVVPIVLALFRERAEKKGVRLSADLSAVSAVEGDARALEHVLSNLVDNAVKYCPPGTHVVVRSSSTAERIHLVVSDSGPGIASEHISRVFERFYRIDAGRSRELGGTGLGLSIVKHMVEAMRGKVWVESEVGKGSIFTVSLPRAGQA